MLRVRAEGLELLTGGAGAGEKVINAMAAEANRSGMDAVALLSEYRLVRALVEDRSGAVRKHHQLTVEALVEEAQAGQGAAA